MARTGRFIGVSRGLLPSLIAPGHMGTPIAADVQAMSEQLRRGLLAKAPRCD